MGFVEGLFILVLGLSTGFQAGKAGAKVEAVETGKVCFDQDYETRKAGCYKVDKSVASAK